MSTQETIQDLEQIMKSFNGMQGKEPLHQTESGKVALEHKTKIQTDLVQPIPTNTLSAYINNGI
jgi:hypothetical protein